MTPRDSSVLAFEIAGRAGFREALREAGPKILEPIMKVEVVTPEDYMGDVIGDLNSRRGQIQGTESRGVVQVVNAFVPRLWAAESVRRLARALRPSRISRQPAARSMWSRRLPG